MTAETLQLATEWDKTFPQSDKVDHKKVTFTNRYGIQLVGDMYTPKGATGQLAAIALAGPFGAVKEQSSGLYAQTLAERGFLTLVFDPSYVGESGGFPRSVASPDINTEDFQAAVDMLSVQDNVDAERIGVLGVCGFGGMAISATAIDPRIKATVTSTMYNMSQVNSEGYFKSEDSEEKRHEKRVAMANQRTEDFKSGSPALVGGLPPEPFDGAPQFLVDYINYYKTDRGYHARSVNSNGGWTVTTAESFLNMPLNAYAGEIRQPVMLVHGDAAHSYYFSKEAYESMAGDNKQLLTVEGASHTDLYDNVDVIPFDAIEAFFNENL